MPRNYDDQSPTAFQRLPEFSREDNWIRSFLRQGRIAHIATARDGQPFLTPSTYWFDEASRRIIFHSNIAGRIRDNLEHNPKVCLEVSELGRMLPSNVSLEFSLQYRSVLVFGTVRVLTDPEEARSALMELIRKYFPRMQAGADYRAVTDKELRATSVYALQIESWSGKENWKDRADQSDEWPALDERWFGD